MLARSSIRSSKQLKLTCKEIFKEMIGKNMNGEEYDESAQEDQQQETPRQ
jgi:hypothetical protein